MMFGAKYPLDKVDLMLYNIFRSVREWRNWQTRMIQVHVLVRACRFKSCFPHQNPDEYSSGFLFCSFYIPNVCQLCFRELFGFCRSNGRFFARKNPLMTRLMTRKSTESDQRPCHKDLIYSVFVVKKSLRIFFVFACPLLKTVL